MRLVINGQERDYEAATLAELWQAETADLELAGPQGFAIALNGTVIRQREWTVTAVGEGDSIEIIRPMQGG